MQPHLSCLASVHPRATTCAALLFAYPLPTPLPTARRSMVWEMACGGSGSACSLQSSPTPTQARAMQAGWRQEGKHASAPSEPSAMGLLGRGCTCIQGLHLHSAASGGLARPVPAHPTWTLLRCTFKRCGVLMCCACHAECRDALCHNMLHRALVVPTCVQACLSRTTAAPALPRHPTLVCSVTTARAAPATTATARAATTCRSLSWSAAWWGWDSCRQAEATAALLLLLLLWGFWCRGSLHLTLNAMQAQEAN